MTYHPQEKPQQWWNCAKWNKKAGACTSIVVDIFFSLIFSYFCFLVPAFNPCQGRLPNPSSQVRKNPAPRVTCNVEGSRRCLLLTCPWESTLAHNQEIPNHLSCSVLPCKTIQTMISYMHIGNWCSNKMITGVALLEIGPWLTNTKVGIDTCISRSSSQILVFPASQRFVFNPRQR